MQRCVAVVLVAGWWFCDWHHILVNANSGLLQALAMRRAGSNGNPSPVKGRC